MTPGFIEIGGLAKMGCFLDITGTTRSGYTVEFVKIGTLDVVGVAEFPSDTLHFTRDGEIVKTFGFPGKARIVPVDGEVRHYAAGVSQGTL